MTVTTLENFVVSRWDNLLDGLSRTLLLKGLGMELIVYRTEIMSGSQDIKMFV